MAVLTRAPRPNRFDRRPDLGNRKDFTNSSITGPVAGSVRKVFFAAAALAGASLVALSAGDAGAAGAPDRAPRANGVGAPIAWGVCDPPGEDLQCARIRVPLDWDRPNGRTIRLALIRHLASKPEQRIGTLFMNPGGPAESGVGVLGGDPEGFDEFGDGRFDVVSWDPRGTNASTRVRCFRDQRSQERFLAGREGSRSPTPPRNVLLARPPRWSGAAARRAAGSCPTSRPPTPSATSTICAS